MMTQRLKKAMASVAGLLAAGVTGGGMWTLVWAAFAFNHTLKARRGQ